MVLHIIRADILLIARIFPRPSQLAKYPRVLYVKPSNKTYIISFSTATHSCLITQFRCANNVCIPKWQFCDGVDQCSDGSDESRCAVIANGCNSTQFKCANRKCIANAFVCDSKDDCGDASDEKYCGKFINVSCTRKSHNLTFRHQQSFVNPPKYPGFCPRYSSLELSLIRGY